MSLRSTPEDFWSHVDRVNGPWCAYLDSRCWQWTRHIQEATNTSSGGYGRVSYHGKLYLTHRLAFFLTNDRWPEPCCNHHCDNRACCNPDHLYEGTQSQNMTDMYERHRANRPTGIHWNRGHLTDSGVREIRDRYAAGGVSQAALAAEFGITQSNVSQIIRRVTRTEVY